MAVKHKFVSQRADTPVEDGNVHPSHWNEEHEVEGVLGEFLEVATAASSVLATDDDGKARMLALSAFFASLLNTASASDLLTAIGALAKAGDAMTGPLAMGGNKITGLADPTNGADAVNKTYADALLSAASGALVFKGAWDASAGSFPGAGAAKTGWFYRVSVAGSVDGKAFEAGDDIFAIVDNASATTFAANWLKIEGGISLAEVQAAVGFTFGSLAAMSSIPASLINDASANGRSLIQAANYAAMRTLLGLGSAALLTAGTGNNNVVQLDGTGKLPAVDASQLTNVPAGAGGWFQENYYSSSQTITIPAATKCEVLMWAPTGGPGNSISNGKPAGGSALIKLLTGLVAGNTLIYTQGATAAAQGSVGAGGNAGGNSTLASGTQTIATLTCNGGAGAVNSANVAGPSATGGDINAAGVGSLCSDGTVTLNRSGITGFHINQAPETNGAAGLPGGLRIRWYK